MEQQINLESPQNSKHIWVILITVIVIIIIGSGIFWWINSNELQWLTYENQNYGYSLKYPQDWILESQNPLYVTLNSPENEQVKQSMNPDRIRDSGYMPDITIAYYSSVKGFSGGVVETLNDLVKSIFPNSKEIVFAGSDGWETIISGDRGDGYGIMVEYNGRLYQIGFNNKPKKSDLTEIDNKIINSFQFID